MDRATPERAGEASVVLLRERNNDFRYAPAELALLEAPVDVMLDFEGLAHFENLQAFLKTSPVHG